MNNPAMTDDTLSSHQEDHLDLFGMLSRRRGFLALGIAIGVLAAALYYFLTPPTYRAEMEILVGQKSGDLVKGANSDSAVEGVDNEEDVLSTHIQLMTSRRILSAAIDKHDLLSIPSVVAAIEEGETPIVYILDNLEVTKGGDGVAKDAHTLRATFDDPSPTDCATVLRAIYDEYESYLNAHFEGTSTQAIDLLTQLSNETAEEVTAAEIALADHLAGSDLMWDGQKTRNIHKERLSSIEENMLELIEKEAETTSRLKVISEFLESSNPQQISDFDKLALLSDKEVNRLKLLFEVTRGDVASEAFQAEQPIRQETARAEYDEYLQLVMREKKLREKFGDGHPTVVSVQEQIELMRQFIDDNSAKIKGDVERDRMEPSQMLDTYVGLLKNDIAGFQQQRLALQEQFDRELKLAKQLEQDEMKAESLRLELARRQDLFASSQDTLKQLNFVRDYAGFSTDVIGDAEAQEKPAWPRPLIVLALGLVAGSVLGFIMGLTAELLDTTFSDPDDVQATLGAAVLAHVPRFPPLKRKRKDPPLLVDPTVYIYHKPRSPEAEMYRVIRTSLVMEAKKNDTRIIQVTSPLPGDGKSTTSVNLAAALAQAGKRTLIVDADLRKPKVAKLLHLEHPLGLTDALLSEAEPMDVVSDTAIDGLDAIGAGTIPVNPAELLQSDLFGQLLRIYREKYDFIVVDSPPVLAVSDAAIISEWCEGVLLALRIIKNGRKAAIRARETLEQQDIPLLGVVVNGYQSKNESYGYTGRYDTDSYGYGYGNSNRGYYRDDSLPIRPASTGRKSETNQHPAPLGAGK